MLRYFSRRLLRAFFLLLAVSALSFCLFELAPGDYFDELRIDPNTSHENIEALRKVHGLGDAITVRYARWLNSVLRGEWGFSVAYNTAAGPLLFERAANTLILTIPATVCAWAVAIPLALFAASGRTWRPRLARTLIAVLLSLPELILLLVVIAAAAAWHVLPVGGMTSPGYGQLSAWERVLDITRHLAVPLTVLVLTALPSLFLHSYTALTEALNAPFISFARANGITKMDVLLHHALPAALNPMVTLLGLSTGTLLSSSLLVESVSGWPGLGHLLLQSLLQRDLLVVAGAVLLSAILLIAGNLLADTLLYIADPRIREDH